MMKKYHIRPAMPQDAATFSELVLSHLPDFAIAADLSGTEQFVHFSQPASFLQRMSDSRFKYFSAIHVEEVIGFVGLVNVSHLQNLYVASDHRGQGIASMLWRAAKEAGLSDGAQFFTVNSSLKAQAVYRHFGFVPTAPCADFHGVRSYPMRLDL